MGAPSRKQIDEAIARGLARGDSEDAIMSDVAALRRLSDAELAELGVVVGSDPAPALIAAPAEASAPAIDFTPIPLMPRRDGWTAGRQRAFIAALAETGCVSEACAKVGITARSAYRLRERPEAAGFRAAWDHAQSLATVRLTALAFERAIHGSAECFYKDGELVAERRKPNDRLLMWLLAHHDPVTYGWLGKPQKEAPDPSFCPLLAARRELPALLDSLADVAPADCPAERLSADDFDSSDSPDQPA